MLSFAVPIVQEMFFGREFGRSKALQVAIAVFD
jgi:hypothetical protein